MNAKAVNCDVAVLGGGPGGSVAAAGCVAAGLDVVIVERGELRGTHLPETWVGGGSAVLDELGVRRWREALRPSASVLLRSVGSGRIVTITTEDGNPADGPGMRLDRVDFDAILLAHAQAAGARVLTGVSATGAQRTPDGVVVCAASRDGAALDLAARVVLDASGKSAVIGRQLNLLEFADRQLDPRVAVFTHVRPADNGSLIAPGAMSITATRDGYVFVIPIDSGRVSVGVVAGENSALARLAEPAAVFEAGLRAVPDVAALVDSGRRLLPVIPAINRTYTVREPAGSWYALLGEAAAFTDPFLSSGLDFALLSGSLAGRFAVDLLAGDNDAPDTYRSGLDALLGQTASSGYAALEEGPAAELLRALTDPHLPPLLTLAAHGYGAIQPAARRRVLADGRAAFAHQRGA